MNKAYLWEKCGALIQQGLLDDDVTEIILNPDKKLWFYSKTEGKTHVTCLHANEMKLFIFAVAKYANQFLHEKQPYLDAVLPFNGERINITIPPIVDEVSFNIRKHSPVILTLADYVEQNIMTRDEADYCQQAVTNKKNILISGGPGSGKTTLANALLVAISQCSAPGERALILEQVPELQCDIDNVKKLYTTDCVSMNKLLWIAMRNSGDRIIVGEVRDGSCLDLLKAWNTGCNGGIATLHSNSPTAAMQRVLDLATEAQVSPPHLLASEAIDVVIQIESTANGQRKVTGIKEINGFDSSKNQFVFQPPKVLA